MAAEAVGVYLDYSKNRIDETLKLLIELAEQKRHRRHAAAAGGNLIVKDVMQFAMVGRGESAPIWCGDSSRAAISACFSTCR